MIVEFRGLKPTAMISGRYAAKNQEVRGVMSRHGLVAVLGLALLLCPAVVWGGMPSPVLTDWALLRFTSISFFGLAFLVATAVIRWLWNSLARDFARLPRLSYGKALAAVGLIGSLLAVVLTMIAGARELMTPGAWVKDGLLYKVNAAPAAKSKTDPLQQRKEQLQRLQVALWDYAAAHEGRFPAAHEATIDPGLWQMPGVHGVRYLLVPDQRVGEPARVLVYEPSAFAGPRLVLDTMGKLELLTSDKIRQRLQSEKSP